MRRANPVNLAQLSRDFFGFARRGIDQYERFHPHRNPSADDPGTTITLRLSRQGASLPSGGLKSI
jgi:hypothetical protein